MLKQSKSLFIHILVVLIFHAAFSFSQSNADSLIQNLKSELVNSKPDTTRINILNALATEYSRSVPDTFLLYAMQALEISEKIEWQKGAGDAHLSVGHAHYLLGDYEKCLFHFNKTLEIRKQLNDKKGISAQLGNIGIVYSNQGNYPKALSYYFKALEMDSVMGKKSGIAINLGNIGIVYHKQGYYPKALSYYFKALEIDSVLGNKSGIATHFGNIGFVYNGQGNYHKALSYYFKALEMNSVMGDKRGIAKNLGNIGIVYHEQGNYHKVHSVVRDSLYNRALSYYFKALEMDSVMGNKSGIAIRLGNIGNVYKSKGDYPAALKHYFKALEIDKALGNKNGMDFHLGDIGLLYAKTGCFKEAETHLKQALNLSDSIGTLDLQKLYHSELSQLYDTLAGSTKSKTQKSKFYKLAYHHHKQYSTLKDSLFNSDKSKELGMLEAGYEYNQKIAAQEAEHEKEKVVTEEQQKKMLVIIWSGGGMLLLLSLLAYFIYRNYRTKKKSLSTLNAAYSKLQELENFKESMTGMIVHDLKNPLSIIMGYSDEQKVKPMKVINQAAKQMINLVTDILDVQKFEQTNVKLKWQDIKLRTVAEDAINHTSFLADQKQIAIINTIPEDAYVEIDSELICRVFINLLTNAVKFTPVVGEINVGALSLEKDGESYYKINVTDNGEGISQDNLKSVFDKFSQIKARESGATRSTGLGLTFCKLAVEANGGEIWVESEPGKGAAFYFTLLQSEDVPVETDTNHIRAKQPKVKPQEAIILDLTQKEMLLPFAQRLRKIQVNNAGEIIKILNEIKSDDNSICAWKETVQEIIFNFNDRGYYQLLDEIIADQKLITTDTVQQNRFPAIVPNVLIVDDEIHIRDLLRKYLEEEGCMVEVAYNGKEAIEKVSKKEYNIILMDNDMPVMSGIEATKQIRSMPKIQQPQIISISGTGDDKTMQAIQQSGINAHLPKPIFKDKLLDAIASLLATNEITNKTNNYV